jgi:hypothetical protein
MNDLQPLERTAPPTLRERVSAALEPVASTVVPGALVGAIYLASGTHWEAAKTVLVSWGVPVTAAVLAAPVVAVGAVFGLRYLWRMMRPARDDETP